MVRSKGIRFTSPLAIGYADESKGPIFVRQHRAGAESPDLMESALFSARTPPIGLVTTH
jgi:hypothetical protein